MPADRRRVLLTVSGTIPDGLDAEVAAGRRPRVDYRVCAERMGADVVDVAGALAATGRVGRVIHRAGAGPLLGWYAFRHRHRYSVVFTDGEHVGIPFAILTRLLGRRGARHAMIAHILSVPKKATVLRRARLLSQIDRFVTYASYQADFIERHLGVPAQRVVRSAFMVDTVFFDPARVDAERRRMICSAGLERRDYPTLITAVDGLDVEVIITASSAWSKRSDSSQGATLPANVTVTRLSMDDFRQMYADAAFVVMPLEEVDFQAGITTILEAMAMGRAVICSRVRGQSDIVVEGVTGVYVDVGDPVALRGAIERLLADPAATDEMGRRGREWVLANARIEHYADAMDGVVADLLR